MDRIPEFIANHPLLVAAFVFLAAVLLITESRRGGKGLAPALTGPLMNRENAILLDVRSESDFRSGHIAGSINIPLTQLAAGLNSLQQYRGKPVIVACSAGGSTGEAVKQLLKAGHAPVYKLNGGITGWRGENLPLVRS